MCWLQHVLGWQMGQLLPAALLEPRQKKSQGSCSLLISNRAAPLSATGHPSFDDKPVLEATCAVPCPFKDACKVREEAACTDVVQRGDGWQNVCHIATRSLHCETEAALTQVLQLGDVCLQTTAGVLVAGAAIVRPVLWIL